MANGLGVVWTAISRNAKTGPIPVSTTAKASCSPSCPLKGNGCYAEQGPLGMMWAAMSGVEAGEKTARGVQTVGWAELNERVAALPAGQLWRHNQAGDLPHQDQVIDAHSVAQLVDANAAAGARGFTYTHHDMTIAQNLEAVRDANAGGFTINLSANNLEHADRLLELDAGPVVALVPADVVGNVKLSTPAGRTVVVCPATYRDDVTCSSCGLCARADRQVVVVFPAHGAAKRKASAVAA